MSLLFIFLFYLLFFSSKFQIKDVIIEGNKLITDQILGSYIPFRNNIFRFNTGAVEKKILQQNPEISSVQIIRGIPNAVKIVVSEHENKLIWQSGNDRYLISTQGKATKKLDEKDNFDLPTIIDAKSLPVNLGENLVSASFVAFVSNINDKFYDYTNVKPIGYEISETTFDVIVKTDAGIYVKLNSLRSSAVQLENLKKVLVAKKVDIHEYVDMRINGWAYYK